MHHLLSVPILTIENYFHSQVTAFLWGLKSTKRCVSKVKDWWDIGKRPTGATSTVNKIVSLDMKNFLHHICRAFLCESYKGWSHIELLAQWLFTMYMKSKNQVKTKKSNVGKMFPIKIWLFWPLDNSKRLCSLGAPGIFVFCSKLLNLTWLPRGCCLPLILWRYLWPIFLEFKTLTAEYLLAGFFYWPITRHWFLKSTWWALCT